MARDGCALQAVLPLQGMPRGAYRAVVVQVQVPQLVLCFGLRWLGPETHDLCWSTLGQD